MEVSRATLGNREKTWPVRLGGLLFKQRCFTGLPLILVCLVVRRGEREADLPVWMIGSGLMVLGLTLRAWSVRYLGKGGRTYKRKALALATQGPYACVRNPVYIANLIVLAGLVTMSELVWMVPVALALGWVQYHLIVLWEEEILRETFGEQADRYFSRVRRWLPRPCRDIIGGHPAVSLGKLMQIESRTFFVSLLLLVLLVMKEALPH